MPNIKMDIEEEIFDKGDDQSPKKKRVLSDKQKEALAKGRERAKQIRDAKNGEAKKAKTETKAEQKKKTKVQEEDVEVAQGLKRAQRTISKQKAARQDAVKKRVTRNVNQKEFDDAMFKIAETLDSQKDLDNFNKYCAKMKHEDFNDKKSMRAALANVIYEAIGTAHVASQNKK
jgi:hypothetical protein